MEKLIIDNTLYIDFVEKIRKIKYDIPIQGAEQKVFIDLR